MALQIQFIDSTVKPPKAVNRFLLREDEDNPGGWIAPEVHLLPMKTLPAIAAYEVQVVGAPPAVVTRLEAAFGPAKRFAKPIQLHERRAITSGRIRDAGPLQANAVCELRVTVHYYETDSQGALKGEVQTLRSVCGLFSGSLPALKPELALGNKELALTADEPTSQTVEVRYPRDGEPKLGLLYPDTLVAPTDPVRPQIQAIEAELRSAFEGALKVAPVRQEVSLQCLSYRFPLLVKLSPGTKQVMHKLAGPLAVPVAASYPDATPVQGIVKIQVASKVFPGWVVVDFGTTNSTATVFDTQDRYPIVGLPDEQESALRRLMVEWLKEPATRAVDGHKGLEDDWKRLLQQTATTLGVATSDGLADWIVSRESQRLYDLLKELGLNLLNTPERFRRVIHSRLYRIQRDALHVPTLRRFQLFPLVLDADRKQVSISSEIEILGIEHRDGDLWPRIHLGDKAQKDRMQVITQAEENAPALEKALQRFHPSPKRYFGSDRPPFEIEIDGRTDYLSVDQLMRSGWERLLQCADEARKHGAFSEGPFRRAIITYPTVAPPSVRQTIQRLIRDLGISDVRTDYDEAVAAAIFYFMREYGAYPELGLESFKARSRVRSEQAWTQNVMVFDIGGGTTDVALIRLTLTEEAVFNPGEDRGAGGRYYRLSPQLISSSGHMQLGGELMTLRIFRLLKAMIADRLLVLVRDKKIDCEPLKAILDTLPEEARADGKYRPGYLPTVVESENPDMASATLRATLDLAERVLPTRWADPSENRAGRLQTFYTLWEYAEEAKKKLGAKDVTNNGRTIPEPYLIAADQVTSLLDLHFPNNYALRGGDLKKDLQIMLTAAQVGLAIAKVVDDAVKIALGTLEHLKPTATRPGEAKDDKLDWLILSGQSCNLALVDQEIRKAFKESKKFIWNPERVTFLPEYAKLSTSIGACFAENQRRSRLAPRAYVEQLRRGMNELYFDINNLFHYLPCSFKIAQSGGDIPVFMSGTELFDLRGDDNVDEACGQARSSIFGAALNVSIYREDYKGSKQLTWGVFDGEALKNQLGMTDKQWRDEVGVVYEIDHRLKIELLLFRRESEDGKPHLLLTGEELSLDLRAGLPKAEERLALELRRKTPANAPNPPEPPKLPPIIADGQLQWVIAVGDAQRPTLEIFGAHQALQTVLLHPGSGGGQAVMLKGLASKECAENFMEDKTLLVWGRPAADKVWIPMGRLERPGEQPIFRRRYRFTLDQHGTLRIHNGEPAYWESTDPQCLLKDPGRVLRRELTPTKRETDEDRNPFTGKH